MDMQKEREAFKAWFKKVYLGIDNLANRGDEGAIARRDYAYIGWQAAKAQAIPDGYKVVPVNYECVWCGCTELDGWTDEAMIEAQEKEVV